MVVEKVMFLVVVVVVVVNKKEKKFTLSSRLPSRLPFFFFVDQSWGRVRGGMWGSMCAQQTIVYGL